MKRLLLFLACFCIQHMLWGQYLIEVKIKNPDPRYSAYLDILHAWDDFTAISADQILQKSSMDSSGVFRFTGQELPDKLGFYRIHFSIDELTPVFITGDPAEKNFYTFMLSNSDSIYIEIDDPFVNPGNLSVRSSLPENADLHQVISQNDRFLIEAMQAQTENQRVLIEKKHQDFLRAQLQASDQGLLKLFALHQGKFSLAKEGELYQEVADLLGKPSYRPSYFQSLEQYIGARLYRDLLQKNRMLQNTLIFCVLLILLLGGILFWNKRRQFFQQNPSTQNRVRELTPKEYQVFQLMAEGLTNKEISTKLFISDSTVKTHINNIYRKTGLNSRKEVRHHVQQGV